jgi:hypothetical protein
MKMMRYAPDDTNTDQKKQFLSCEDYTTTFTRD